MLEKAGQAPIESDGTSEMWQLLPRIRFTDLPDRYKKIVRSRFTVTNIRIFLAECYPEEEFKHTIDSIPKKDLDRLFIKARNTAIYTIESKDEPILYGNHACEAFEKCLEEYESEAERKAAERKAAKDSKEKVERITIQKLQKDSNSDRIVTNGYYQQVLSDEDYRYAMTLKKNQTAYISIFDPSAFEGLKINDEGYFMLNDEIRGRIKNTKRGKYEDISKINLALLHQCYTAAFKSIQSYGNNTITVYQPQFFKEAGIEAYGEKANGIMKDIMAFSDLWGMLPNYNAMYKVFSLISIDSEKKTMTFAVPYFMRLWEILDEKNHIEHKTKKGEVISFDRKYHNMLVHSSIVSERNKPAINLVYLVVNSLIRRSDRPDGATYKKKTTTKPGIVTYSITFRSLLNEEPVLRARIQSLKSTSDQNKALKRAFTGLYALLKKKTDVTQYYVNVKWDEHNIPTIATLDKLFVITHEGKNGEYQRHV